MARCVHCLTELPAKGPGRTKDHAPPRGWYPEGASGQRPTAPSCPGCNEQMRQIEAEVAKLQRRFILDPRGGYYQARGDAALRAMSPESAKTEQDRHHRELKRAQFIREAQRARESEGGGHALPGFDVSHGPKITLEISRHTLSAFAEKMVRVLTYWAFRQYVETPHVVTACPLLPDAFQTTASNPDSVRFDHADGLLGSVTLPLAENQGRFWVFLLWGTLELGAIEGRDPSSRGLHVDRKGGTRWTNGTRVERAALRPAMSSDALLGLLRLRPPFH